MASADGRITIEIELEDGTVQRGLADIGNQADKSGGRITSAFGKAGNALKTVGKVAVGAVVGVTALAAAAGGLAVPLVKAAAEAQALNSQFTQVFGKLEKSAYNSINAIADATGIANGRLQGSFLQIAAFAKTTGVDTKSAIDLSSRAMVVAADSAAFYDKSLEDVTESLQSFLKGNFENDSALGISATETTRNAVATKLFAKEFKGLSEAQKQVALLTMVEEGNKLGGALGQAARETDGLENVLGNLKQAWLEVKIALGGAVLETAIKLLKGLTAVINNIDTAPLVAGLTMVVDAFKRLYEYVQPFVSNLFSLFQTALSNIKKLWESEGQSIVDGTISTFTTVYKVIKNVFTVVMELVSRVTSDVLAIWNEYGDTILEYTSTIFNAVLAVFNFVLPAIQFVIEKVWNIIVDIITGALDVIIGAVKIFSGLFTGDFKKLWDGVVQLFKGAVKLILGIISISFVGAIRTAITNFFKAIVGLVKNQWSSIVNIFKSSTSTITNGISGFINSVLGFFRNLGTNARNIVVGLWNGISSSFSVGVSNALRFVTNLKDRVISIFRSINLFSIGKNIVQGLINGIGALASSVGDVVKKLVNKIPKTIREVLNIHSPSRVTTELGEFTGEGIAVGLDKTEGLVTRASSNLAKAAIPNNLTNKLSGTSVNVGRVSSGNGLVGTNALNTSTVDNSKSATYNINLQNDKTAELERTLRRIQFAY